MNEYLPEVLYAFTEQNQQTRDSSILDVIPVAAAILGVLVGYIVGVARDRLATVRSKQIEIINSLHDRVLEIENMELSDGRSLTLAVIVDSRSDKSQEAMSDAEVAYLGEQERWREKL